MRASSRCVCRVNIRAPRDVQSELGPSGHRGWMRATSGRLRETLTRLLGFALVRRCSESRSKTGEESIRSTEGNKAVLYRFREALDAGDLDRAIAAFAPNAVVHLSGASDPLTLDGFKQFGRVFLNAFSDGRSTIEDVIAEGNKVVSRITYRGTHAGDLMGIPPTGRSVIVAEIIVDQFADGRIVESWRLFDQMAMMQQLGVMPATK